MKHKFRAGEIVIIKDTGKSVMIDKVYMPGTVGEYGYQLVGMDLIRPESDFKKLNK